MPQLDFAEIVDGIRTKDHRYDRPAFFFVRQGLDYTVHNMTNRADRVHNHVSCKELLDGLRKFALEQYGPMSYEVLTSWGIKKCEDFGEIVFLLIDAGILGKREEDKRSDFEDGFNFKEAFEKPFQPKKKVVKKKRVARKKKVEDKPEEEDLSKN